MPVVSCSCGKKYKVSDETAGKKIRCKECGETIAVPGGNSVAKKPAKSEDDDLDWDNLSNDELSEGDASTPAPAPPRRGSAAGSKPKAAAESRSSGGGPSPIKMVGGVLAMLLGVSIAGFAIYNLVAGEGGRAGGGAVTGGLIAGVGWRWLRNKPVE